MKQPRQRRRGWGLGTGEGYYRAEPISSGQSLLLSSLYYTRKEVKYVKGVGVV